MERTLRGLPSPAEKCPWCGSTITHAKFLQIQTAIREDERKKLAEQERMLRTSLQKEVAAQQQKLQKERNAIDAERADKLNRLFRFMTSSGFKRKLAEASDLANEALEIDVQEKRAHDTVWKKRGTVLTRIKHVLREIDTDVSAIVEARDDDDEPPAPVQLRPAAYRVTQK